MDIEELWNKALKGTEIYRLRLEYLSTFQPTNIDYVVLSRSEVSENDTVIRKGSIQVMQPLIVLPPDYPVLEGFDFKEEVGIEIDSLRAFLYMRGVRLPSLKYYNQTYTLDLWEVPLSDAISKVQNEFERREDTKTGVIVAPNDVWQFSLLIYITCLVNRSFDNDIKRIIDRYREKN